MTPLSVVKSSAEKDTRHLIPSLPVHQTLIDTDKQIIFKEISDEAELVEMFALRSLVYEYVDFFSDPDESPLLEHHLDIDAYDLYSTFIGAFEVTGHGKKLIGTLRIISGDEETAQAPYIRSLYHSIPGNEDIELLERKALFPHLETFNVPFKYYNAFFGIKNDTINYDDSVNNKPYEISRLAVLPEYWKTRDRVTRGLHEIVVLNSWRVNPKRNIFIIATHPETKRRYERLGFSVIPGTHEQIYKNINKPAILMSVNMSEYLNTPNTYSRLCTQVFPLYMEKGYYTREMSVVSKVEGGN